GQVAVAAKAISCPRTAANCQRQRGTCRGNEQPSATARLVGSCVAAPHGWRRRRRAVMPLGLITRLTPVAGLPCVASLSAVAIASLGAIARVRPMARVGAMARVRPMASLGRIAGFGAIARLGGAAGLANPLLGVIWLLRTVREPCAIRPV